MVYASEHHHKHRAPPAADKIRCARAPCCAFGVACWLLLPFASAVSRRFISGRCPRNPGFLNLCVIGGRFHILLQFSALPEASGNLVPTLLEQTSFTGRSGICSRRLPISFDAAFAVPSPCFAPAINPSVCTSRGDVGRPAMVDPRTGLTPAGALLADFLGDVDR